jgi:hypothetical protein
MLLDVAAAAFPFAPAPVAEVLEVLNAIGVTVMVSPRAGSRPTAFCTFCCSAATVIPLLSADWSMRTATESRLTEPGVTFVLVSTRPTPLVWSLTTWL